jgi:hypothetical protein
MEKSKKEGTFAEIQQEIATTLIYESDRGCVLAAQSFMDYQLEGILCMYFHHKSGDTDSLIKGLFEGSNPLLQSFSLKTRFARILRLIDPESFNALGKLNELRIHFAHHPGPVTLNATRVKRIHDLLNPNCKIRLSELYDLGMWNAQSFKDISEPHIRFVAVASELIGVLELAKSMIMQGMVGVYLGTTHRKGVEHSQPPEQPEPPPT